MLSAAAPAKRWTVLTTKHRGSWPLGYSDVLDGCGAVGGVRSSSGGAGGGATATGTRALADGGDGGKALPAGTGGVSCRCCCNRVTALPE